LWGHPGSSGNIWCSMRWFGRLVYAEGLDDQAEAYRRVFASDSRRTVVSGNSLEEGESQSLPV